MTELREPTFESGGYRYGSRFTLSVDLNGGYRVQILCEDEDLESLIAVIGTNLDWRLLSVNRIGIQSR